MLKFALYASNHGYGHASRIAALAEEFGHFGIQIVIRTNRPHFLFRDLNPDFIRLSESKLDLGVIHGTNLQTDMPGTKKALLELFNNRNDLVASEVEFLNAEKIDAVIADIPFLAIEAAKYAGIPSIVISNFDWFFIYREIFKNDKSITPLINNVFGIYQTASLAYRLPFSDQMSMQSFPDAKPVGVLARRKHRHANVRKIHDIPLGTPIALSSHGGEGEIDLSLDSFCQAFKGVLFSPGCGLSRDNHIQLDKDADFISYLNAADILLTKPGYSSFAEAVSYNKVVFYKERTHYPEERVLTGGMNSYPKAVNLGQKKYGKKDWLELLAQVPKLSIKSKPRFFNNRNREVASTIVADYLLKTHKSLISIIDIGSNNLSYCLYDAKKDRAVHSMQLTTGLGKGLKHSALSEPDISMTVKQLTALNSFDRLISSSKYILGTAASRRALNIDVLNSRVYAITGHNIQVLKGREEAGYALKAVEKHIDSRKEYLVVDLGGLSTELVYVSINNPKKFISLDTGLMDLARVNDDDRKRTIVNMLSNSFSPKFIPIVATGLSPRILYQIINKTGSITLVDGLLSIKKMDLKNLYKVLSKEDLVFISEFPFKRDQLNIVKSSCQFFIELLDRFQGCEIMVCTDCIAYGYARAVSKRNKGKL